MKQGRDASAPTLAAVMWEGMTALFPLARPALLDHPFLRSSLEVREEATLAYLTEQWREPGCPHSPGTLTKRASY